MSDWQKSSGLATKTLLLIIIAIALGLMFLAIVMRIRHAILK